MTGGAVAFGGAATTFPFAIERTAEKESVVFNRRFFGGFVFSHRHLDCFKEYIRREVAGA